MARSRITSPDKRFLREAVLPIAESVIAFYDKRYERGLDEALNPLPEIAGLRSLLNEMLTQVDGKTVL